MSRGIVDTCVLIDLHLGTVTADELPDEQAITSLSLGELGLGVAVATTDADRIDRQARLDLYRDLFRGSTLPYDADAAMQFGHVITSILQRGKRAIRRRTVDLQIAAIAVRRQLPLYTVNDADFEGIAGLEVVRVSPLDA